MTLSTFGTPRAATPGSRLPSSRRSSEAQQGPAKRCDVGIALLRVAGQGTLDDLGQLGRQMRSARAEGDDVLLKNGQDRLVRGRGKVPDELSSEQVVKRGCRSVLVGR